MLKNKTVEINISSSNYNIYYDKYGPFKKGDKIIVDVDDLSENSVAKVIAICKFCNIEKKLTYQTYLIQFKRGNYYCCSKCRKFKQKEMMAKNNVVFFLSNPEYKKRMIKLYGVDNPSKLEKIKEIRSERLKNKDYQKKLSDAIYDKYNVTNISKLSYIKEKKIQTCLKNYGVENPSQNEIIFIKSQKSGKKIKFHNDTNLYYRGTYEKDFLDYCYNNNIIVEKGKSITFKYKNKNKVYHSDFYIKEQKFVIEIKSSYYYDKYLDLNIAKKIATINQGYNFIFIINKDYEQINKILNL